VYDLQNKEQEGAWRVNEGLGERVQSNSLRVDNFEIQIVHCQCVFDSVRLCVRFCVCVCVRACVCACVQSVLSVFRSLSTLEKTVDYFSLYIDCKLSKLVFIFHCRHGMICTEREREERNR
jgi:hypothetical protein